MKLNKILLGIYLILACFFMNSCGIMVLQTGIATITVKNKALPPDFGKDNTVLICILTGKRNYDKSMKKHVINEYGGLYEFVLREDLHSDKYNDFSKYRYVFDYNEITRSKQVRNSTTGMMDTQDTTTASYYILDRKKDMQYISPFTSSFFGKLIKAYMRNLEKERLRHQ